MIKSNRCPLPHPEEGNGYQLAFFAVTVHVDRYRSHNNHPFDDVLNVRIDTNEGESAFNQAKDHCAN